MAHHHDVALLLGQRVERGAQRARAVERRLVGVRVRAVHLLRRDGAAPAQMVERDVARHPQQPAREGDAAVVVLADHRDQLQEDVLGEVFGLLLVAHDRAHVAVHVVGVAHVQQPQRLAVALLCPRDREAHLAHRLGRLVERRASAQADLAALASVHILGDH